MRYLLSQLVEPIAELTPGKTAFRFLQHDLSYAALSERTDQLAFALHHSGVRRGDRVGVLLDKSLECAVAVYGIMKAGAAYVPLDVSAPAAQLAGVMGRCGVRHLVSHEPRRAALEALLSSAGSLDVLIGAEGLGGVGECIPWSEVSALPAGRVPPVALTEQDLAYIIFTSGSTGQPKGIVHTHRSGLAYAAMAAHVYGVTAQDRLSNHAALNFDQSTFDFFCAPLTGATTVIIPEMYAKLPASLSELIQRERLSIWYSVPHALIQLLLHGVLEERDLGSLRWVKFGGEPFPPKHLRRLMDLLPGARFSNVYGPAELNQCTWYHVPSTFSAETASVSIGWDCPNAASMVIDDDDQPVPPGEIGELVVRSATMMRGYWGQPALNARAFYRRPLSADLTEDFYRTGDLVEQCPDGSHTLIGRRDRQIKTRGFRVELDEVEAALAEQDCVHEAAAYPVRTEDDTVVVEAAVTPAGDVAARELPELLTARLRARLAAYAVPQAILVIDDFPRTTSGKIDRRALALQARQRRQTEEGS